MKLTVTYLKFLLPFLLVAFNGYGQSSHPVIIKQDTTISKAAIGHFKQEIYMYKEKAKLQELEIRVLKETAKVDSLRFGKDSLMVSYYSATGKPLKTIKQKFYPDKKNFDDSTVVYFNENGLIEYKEYWQNGEKRKLPQSDDFVWVKTKLTYRRYEYNDQNRLIRQVVYYPTPRTIEYTYTYDSSGNQVIHSRRFNHLEFWDAPGTK